MQQRHKVIKGNKFLLISLITEEMINNVVTLNNLFVLTVHPN